jgi:hypothetical protein
VNQSVNTLPTTTKMTSQNPTPTFLFQSLDNQQPKSPKSPKMTLENPLLKNPFMGGSTNTAAPLLISEQVPRTPLMPMTMNERKKPPQQQQLSFMATPGPPPKASLSLMGTIPSMHVSTCGVKVEIRPFVSTRIRF